MTLSFERTRSPITGWFRSCWDCFEREMQICHSQPHLVPPMKLVVYDDLPSPGLPQQSRNSLSSWFEEGRHMASRVSRRASLSWKRPPPTPLKISDPSDFRRVQSFQLDPTPAQSPLFEPLQLSIHRLSNRLSDLPSFESFCMGGDDHDETPAPSTMTLQARRQSIDARFSISRKPVGSVARRMSVNSERLIRYPPPAHFAGSLLPHFSSDTAAGPAGRLLDRSIHGTFEKTQDDVSRTASKSTPNNQQYFAAESLSSHSTRTFPSRLSSLRRPSTTETQMCLTSEPLPEKIHEWDFDEKSSTAGKGFHVEADVCGGERFRSLSGTTLGSAVTSPTGRAFEHRANDSFSSASTNGVTPRTLPPLLHLSSEKALEARLVKQRSLDSQHRQCPPSPYYADGVSQYRGSAIGIAF
ncbi:hypothetical protein N7539_001153 [Penicillium diatomitis]|uniref:Uncharacterized protein n=1 Tax=Penicillium diatomitis TaxID=2819901 RepID=A0A9W9XN20_9EURO|nr:uncharacterized protein N7539_001153 [Penicillium diatomitis]KAJ5496037.1 hypothetical protein N7539_001153 [Penicillium diatomitis]